MYSKNVIMKDNPQPSFQLKFWKKVQRLDGSGGLKLISQGKV